MLILVSPVFAGDLGGSLLRDYPVALTLPHLRLEFTADYLLMNDTVDIFDVRESRISEVAKPYRAATLGDMQGFRAMLNYGLLERTTLHSLYQYRDLDFGLDSAKVHTAEFSVKQSLQNENESAFPLLAIDAGVRFNGSEDQVFDTDGEINALIDRLDPANRVDVRVDPAMVWFDRRVNGNSYSLGVSRMGRPNPQISTADTYDVTPYLRLTGGRIYGWFFPNVYLEYGHSFIESKVDTTLDQYIPASLHASLPALPLDLSREEDYVKAGVNLLIKLPYRALLRFDYTYYRFFRGDDLDYMDYNHTFQADLNLYLRKWIILNVGGTYYDRQLNGIIPFLYNEQTQTTFDHAYGVVHAGLTFLFDVTGPRFQPGRKTSLPR